MSGATDLSQTVQISDNETVENGTCLKNSQDAADVIIIDDDESQKSDNGNNNCIVINSGVLFNKKCVNNYDDIYEENKLFAEYIEKLLDLENSEGMLRIVNRNLIKKYRESKETFRNSKDFQQVLEKSIRILEVDPDHKFSNVKNICTKLKNNGIKRISPILLSKEIKSFTNHKLKRNKQPSGVNKKQRVDVIDLDDCSSTNKDDEPMEIIDLEDSQNVDTDVKEVLDLDSEKENLIENHAIAPAPENCDNLVEIEINTAENHENNSYLVPLTEVEWIGNSPVKVDKENFIEITDSLDIEDEAIKQKEKEAKIKSIESMIASITVIIEKLDQEEVSNYDSVNSPYILSEKYKAQIVKLYEELCELTGSVPVKYHTVRLEVSEGHPSGAVKLLEAFINNSIGSDGLPSFPDINDVVKCVEMANKNDNLNWNRRQIMKEASALFTQCGRALQKRRQKREYRDLLSWVRVPSEQLDFDPADQDPSLQAKLQENRRLAMQKERDLLDKYSRMELNGTASALNIVANDHTDSDDNCDDYRTNFQYSSASHKNYSESVKNNEGTTGLGPIKNIAPLATENSELNNTSSEESRNIETNTSTGNSEIIETDQTQKTDRFKSKDIENHELSKNCIQPNIINNIASDNKEDIKVGKTENDAKEINVIVKQEPNDSKETQDQVDGYKKDCVIKKELVEDCNKVIPDDKIKEELELLFSGKCDDCEVTVFDIEDPLLIINISDSSDED